MWYGMLGMVRGRGSGGPLCRSTYDKRKMSKIKKKPPILLVVSSSSSVLTELNYNT